MKTINSKYAIVIVSFLYFISGDSLFNFINPENLLYAQVTGPWVGAYNEHSSINEKPNSMNDEPEAGPELEQWYFENWHEPYGNILPEEKLNKIWTDINKLPDEKQLNPNIVSAWRCIGPFGMNLIYYPGLTYTGRVLDIELSSGVTRIASASGGLWSGVLLGFAPVSDALTSLAIGSFASKPGDANTIIVGTGETGKRAGTGFFITTNYGSSWSQCTIHSSTPYGTFRIRYNPQNTNQIFAATTNGFYRSDDGGQNFYLKLGGSSSDMIVGPAAGQIWISVWGSGLYESTNNGDNWTHITGIGYPASDLGRTALGLGYTQYGTCLLASVAKYSDGTMLGIYRSYDNGGNWVNISPPMNIFGSQGWYDNVIAGSPFYYNVILAGGIRLWRSSDMGSSWTPYTGYEVHADYHAITWSTNSGGVWVGNDGGISVSNDGGLNWTTAGNNLPITQYYNIAVGGNNANTYKGIIFGGAQDCGISGTTNNGASWNQTRDGDGGGVSIDPNFQNRVWETSGLYNNGWTFEREKSTDFGQSWASFNSGVDPSGQWFTKIRNDQVSPVTLFTNSGPFVYVSYDNTNWAKLNNSYDREIANLNVARFNPGGGGDVVYACMNSTIPGQILKVYDGGIWYERSNGFPMYTGVRGVAVHPTNNNVAFALMNGLGTIEKVFKTTNRGVNWTNITGDLPDIPMGDLVAHPYASNELYLGTEMGCFKTTNGGVNWYRWNNGMPPANIITEMSYIDSTSINGKFYVVAGTYGRSVWIRDVDGDDPNGVNNENNNIPAAYYLYQNYPNPFNPATTIMFDLPKSGITKLLVYDITGRQTAVLVNDEKLGAGRHEVTFDGTNLSSGVYFYRIISGDYSDVKKMVLVK